ncbi:Glucose/arabinose dehydrogenase, beta-propeller fold [Fodinibius roseus]|uniref:Glucose/arabinose dehydrogenase, beta-propeller fold n=1 Tax=Fodinibius roseus TaxID=1194090 RepID=A0A1M5ALK7_9BACT|nr:PQQ-dependent sugar dehydrogenase [Fodinibius roseus]SHF31055.1 Glucose/arabinose dehydrogenase, beta-propeller fold [Fodinibius roseus]
MEITVKPHSISFLGLASFIFFFGCTSFDGCAQQVIDNLSLPEGFSVEIYASDVPDVRQMVLSNGGMVYAGSRDAGKIYAIADHDNDFQADTVYTIDEDLRLPSGVAYRGGSLYVGAVSRILRYDDIDERLEDPPEPVVVSDSYPSEGHHGWKFIAFGPDGKLYVPVGAPCNICDSDKEMYASITKMSADGSNREIIAHGVRNSVGFDWHPETGELWFTDNGRDWMGDNQPPCELNHLTEKGQHFGYPYKHGSGIWDPEFGEQGKDSGQTFRPPARELGPHVAPLGMIFYTGDLFPEEYQHDILIAEHGSWNRSEKVGYRITRVSLNGDKAGSYESFAEGWLQENDAVWGRPVDLLQLSDGSVLISDDHRGVIYRVTYNP